MEWIWATLNCGTPVKISLAYFGRIDEYHCPHHGTMAPIQQWHALEWRVRCPDCSYGRWTGLSEQLARELQDAHIRLHPTHFPSVAYDRKIGGKRTLEWEHNQSRKIDVETGQMTLPIPDEPPF